MTFKVHLQKNTDEIVADIHLYKEEAPHKTRSPFINNINESCFIINVIIFCMLILDYIETFLLENIKMIKEDSKDIHLHFLR